VGVEKKTLNELIKIEMEGGYCSFEFTMLVQQGLVDRALLEEGS
jgi:hypothetical protein